MPNFSRMFPNGATEWKETHFEIVAAITRYTESPYFDEDEDNELCKRFREQGTGGLYELSDKWTTEFETKYKGTVWGEDLEYMDTLEEFLTTKFTAV